MSYIGPFGSWTHDEHGLPCFDLVVDETLAPYDPLHHLISSGRISGFCDRWGNLSLFTCDGGEGFLDITRCQHQCRSAIYPRLQIGDAPVSALAPGEWSSDRCIRYGVGYARYEGTHRIDGQTIGLSLMIAAHPDQRSCFYATLTLRNRGGNVIDGSFGLAGDCSLVDNYHTAHGPATSLSPGRAALEQVHPRLGDFVLQGPEDCTATACSLVGIALDRRLHLKPGEVSSLTAQVGYGSVLPSGDTLEARQAWLVELETVTTWDYPESWMRDECRWALAQFLSFTVYDGSMGEAIVDLGGYGWRGFNPREVGENAIGLSVSNPERAATLLRWMAKRSWANGDHPTSCNFHPITRAQPAEPESSDTELWFLLGIGSYCLDAGHNHLLDEQHAGLDGQAVSIYEHALRSWRYVVEEIGLGAHGLVRSWRGDWNDYLHPMGRAGRGESVKNSGMACRAGLQLATLARQRGDDDQADTIEAWVQELQEAVAGAWAGSHYLRGYTDDGRPVGDEQLFINAQSWAALGGCGDEQQRHAALRKGLEHNATELGLCLVNPPFPSPPPADISSLPIPPGEGENGGVWPQTVAWYVWALAEEGLCEEALALWQRNTLRHHYATYPATPFGIWNGPDCYNSHLAGPRAHWTQTQLWDRRIHNPMNPSVAWQSFAMHCILSPRREVMS